ncbi:MAG TPA: hypothetical protein VNZ52_09835 [Candidatus Thermoplasmatota archaeon]|nr:hypothetical protein [Candidatus Thermoplasmatota archaeon]
MPPASRTPKYTGALGWVERQIISLQDDPERAGKAFRYAYWVSVGFVLFGYAVILITLFRLESPSGPYAAIALGTALAIWGGYALFLKLRRGRA